jgi:hypothetical protein
MLSETPWTPMYATAPVPPEQPLMPPGAAMAMTPRNMFGRAQASA